jgi:hypothetical protein
MACLKIFMLNTKIQSLTKTTVLMNHQVQNSKPTMPAGTLRVDVSDVYDWYKLGQHISNMKGLGQHDFGQGPPSSIISFGDEDTEHKFMTKISRPQAWMSQTLIP